VRSILAQTYRDFELVISDNGSTDSTVGILEKLAGEDDRIVLLLQPENRGAAWNYNAVFSAARGELFRWHAHDDWFEPELLERLVGALDADPFAILAHTWTRFVDDDGEFVRVYRDDLGVESDQPIDRLGNVLRRLTYCNPVFGLIRRDELAETALIDSFPGSDATLLYELAVRGRFAVVPEPLFVRRPGNSIRSNPTTRLVAHWFDPSGRGARFPGLLQWKATFGAILRSPHPIATRVGLLGRFVVQWPLEWARRHRRKVRRRATVGAAPESAPTETAAPETAATESAATETAPKAPHL
jgi:glycosyltransferase involved in cell wall biosynthesis